MSKKYQISGPWPVGAVLVDAGSIVEATEVPGEWRALTGNLANSIVKSNALPPGSREVSEEEWKGMSNV